MNKPRNFSTYYYGLAMLIFVFLLPGCGQVTQVGPSNDKARLDYEQSLQLLSRAMRSPLRLKSFDIVNRETLAEDRVKFHLLVSVGKAPEKVTLLYQLNEGGVWVVTRTLLGHL
ncbi:MAG: hypothetical protein AB2805_08445 [Candidatus Thiodiazotropha sp.]